jgi:hypothetical protein
MKLIGQFLKKEHAFAMVAWLTVVFILKWKIEKNHFIKDLKVNKIYFYFTRMIVFLYCNFFFVFLEKTRISATERAKFY